MIVSVFWLIFYPFFGLILQILGKKTADLKANLNLAARVKRWSGQIWVKFDAKFKRVNLKSRQIWAAKFNRSNLNHKA